MSQRSRDSIFSAPRSEMKGEHRARQPKHHRRGQGSGPHGTPLGQRHDAPAPSLASPSTTAISQEDPLDEMRRECHDPLSSWRESQK